MRLKRQRPSSKQFNCVWRNLEQSLCFAQIIYSIYDHQRCIAVYLSDVTTRPMETKRYSLALAVCLTLRHRVSSACFQGEVHWSKIQNVRKQDYTDSAMRAHKDSKWTEWTVVIRTDKWLQMLKTPRRIRRTNTTSNKLLPIHRF